ncbi:hypothetical protein [Nonomuraea sp. NPDC003709]|uniref:hypothetical protein n=1 Tax=Nonomuraea sp. NPDC003709 TaxID=3154450 RepID=UPI00339DFBFB
MVVSQADVVVLEADGPVGQANTVQREAGDVAHLAERDATAEREASSVVREADKLVGQANTVQREATSVVRPD